jgi:murein DD-endopeptidase MepM/ murein hydrolase activator NlpD
MCKIHIIYFFIVIVLSASQLVFANDNLTSNGCYTTAYIPEVAYLSELALRENNQACVTFPYLEKYSNPSQVLPLYHAGIDLRASYVPVYSIVAGKVITVGGDVGMVMIEADLNGSKVKVNYLHLSAFDVMQGQWVERGTRLGNTGDTGSVGSPHLHIEVRINYPGTSAVGRISCPGSCDQKDKVKAITLDPVEVLGNDVPIPPPLGDEYNDFRMISVAHIQTFLEQFPNGDLKDPYLYTRFNLDENNFYQIETDWRLDELRDGVAFESPAKIIYLAAKENAINPVLLLAKIQQEQSLIEQPADQHRLNRATGYGIPNSNPAGDPKYKSFLAQLTGLTYQFNEFRDQGLTFRQAYDKYTVDHTGQDASFERFMAIYESFAVLMDNIVQGHNPTMDIKLSSAISITPYPIVHNAPVTVTVTLINAGSTSFNGDIAAALHSTIGTFLGNIQLKPAEILSAGYSRKYVFYKPLISSAPGQYHIQIKYQSDSAGMPWDVVPEGNYTNPYPVQIVENTITPPSSSDYVWMGNGSIISYHGRLLPDYAGKDWPYGITQDVVKLHATAGKAVGFFQWQVTEADCRQLRLDAEGLMPSQNQVDITMGIWNDRDDDITFSHVQLPFVLGRANTHYRFDMEDSHWYVVKVAFLNRLTQAVKLKAHCTYETPTSANYRHGGGEALIMADGYQWQGNGSVISHMFRSLYGQRNNVGLNRDWPYGAFQDVTRIQRSSAKPMVFFQWQPDAVCSQLTLAASQLSDFEKTVDIVVKPWNASPDQATVYRNKTLPYTIYGDGDDGSWRLIQVKFLNAVGRTAEVSARCPGID